jgi:anti-sigma regulatory factor (Ser/Thr protein kinase)
MAWDIAFRINATPDLIRVTRKGISAMALAVGASEIDARDIELGVAEALRYAYEHAYQSTPGQIDLTVGFHGTHFTVTIRDHTPVSGPLAEMPTSPSGKDENRGLYLIRKLADQASLEAPEDGPGTLLRFVKRIHWEPAGGSE